MHTVEERDGFFFVICPEGKKELITVFDHEVTAREIAAKASREYPFFQSIPKIDYGAPYPRPGTIVPRPFPAKVKI